VNQTTSWDDLAFAAHFAGCGGMCNGAPERLGKCDAEYFRIYSQSITHLRDAGEQICMHLNTMPVVPPQIRLPISD
jgi:hypothetical protein